jgi:hypothetical protein
MNENVRWLVSVPANDCNFKNHLKYASVNELEEALKRLPEYGNKTKIKAITAELRRRTKNEPDN